MSNIAIEEGDSSLRQKVHNFLNPTLGGLFDYFTVVLILANVVTFCLATTFNEKYNPDPPFECNATCDALWFGNRRDNALSFLNMGARSALELVTVVVFTVELAARLWIADLIDYRFSGFFGRLRFLVTIESLIDLAATVPFFLDAFLLPDKDLASSQFLRMFRLFQVLRVEGRYDLALGMFDDVLYGQRDILGTVLFIGTTVWAFVSTLYYYVERTNLNMIYCRDPTAHCSSEVDTLACTIDQWGIVDCSDAGCRPTDDNPEPCYNLFRSIPSSSYFALLNLLGEFPLIGDHSNAGKIIGTFVAVVAVAVFAIPAGIVGSGFQSVLAKRRKLPPTERIEKMEDTRMQSTFTKAKLRKLSVKELWGLVEKHKLASLRQEEQLDLLKDALIDFIVIGKPKEERKKKGISKKVYDFLHDPTSTEAIAYDYFSCALVLATVLTFMLDTLPSEKISLSARILFDQIELFSGVLFTVEYLLRLYCSTEDPRYKDLDPSLTRFHYTISFYAIVDLLSFLPLWVELAVTGHIAAQSSVFVKCFRILRLLRFERHIKAFTTFDDIIKENIDILTMTGFTALILWVFFATIMYWTERDNPDPEIALNYRSIPDAMWVTFLNLSGEFPLCFYSPIGKFVTGIMSLFASGLFGIPMGVLGAGFEEMVTKEEDNAEDASEKKGSEKNIKHRGFEHTCFCFVNGDGSVIAEIFFLSTYVLIISSICIGIIQTVPGQQEFLQKIEWFMVYFFTFEYALRFVGASADSHLGGGFILSRIRFITSFFSIIDLVAIIPFYYANMFPASWIAGNTKYLRMFRLFRLLKLEKYFPSISLIDDVIRLKSKALAVTSFAAGFLWILFAALLYLAEKDDVTNSIDPVPLYGCQPNACSMSDRFQHFFDALFYAGVHLTGDFPIITYTPLGRVVCFFIVIAAVGVVAIPSGLVSSGFSEAAKINSLQESGNDASEDDGDDWYEIRLKELTGKDPPLSRLGPSIDKWQTLVDNVLNGNSKVSTLFRRIMFSTIFLDVAAILAESIPEVGRYTSENMSNLFVNLDNYFAIFFSAEYMLR